MSGGMRYVCDGVESDPYDQAWESEFSPDSSKFAYIGLHQFDRKVRNDWQTLNYSLAINGKEIGTYLVVSLPTFSHDGKRMAFRATAEVQLAPPSFIVVDSVQEPSHDSVGLPVFSPDGKHLAYAVERDKFRLRLDQDDAFIVVDGTNLPRHFAVYTPVFSPDSQKMAYRVLDREIVESKVVASHNKIILDGISQDPYDRATDPVFSPDSKHLAYCAKRGKQAFILLDGKESEPFDKWCGEGTPFFDSTKLVHCFGIKDGMIVRVTKEVP